MTRIISECEDIWWTKATEAAQVQNLAALRENTGEVFSVCS